MLEDAGSNPVVDWLNTKSISSRPGGHRWDAIQWRPELTDIVLVARSGRVRERDAGPVEYQVVLRTRFAAWWRFASRMCRPSLKIVQGTLGHSTYQITGRLKRGVRS